ncbi:hypothetical protein X768_01790 [Mesorhizobium sp. LSJC265A00]|nr:hypothetical protein X768_01790 [Mesorhizobium sp. LSJC265A00]ESY08728.1 hypothetical protein X753_07510 [Mesorhizobium sp. LNJC399B00]
MRRRRQRPAESSLALSFIDTISGGFGAAFFLFLIFASMPFESSSASGGASRFMEIWLHWQSSADLMEITLEHESGVKVRMTASDFAIDPYTGALSAKLDKPLWRSAQVNGFSWFGETAMQNGAQAATRLRVADPCPGKWRITATLHSHPAGQTWLATPVAVSYDGNARVFDGVSRNSDYVAERQDILPGATVVMHWQTNAGASDEIDVQAPPRQKLPYCPKTS